MEGTAQKMLSGFRFSWEPLKEPLGFIRLLEWVFAIFAFATTGGYSGETDILINCPGTTAKALNINLQFFYPFRLNQISFDVNCLNNTNEIVHLVGNFSSSAEFYVAIGVLAFLFCTVMLVVYLGYQHMYHENSQWAIVDFLLTVFFAFMWLVSSSAWAEGLSNVKKSTSPVYILSTVNICKNPGNLCSSGALPSMGKLNVSVIFGFLNLILWGGNCWFLYKETPWHKPPPTQGATEEGAP
ncbi:SYPL2 protein, partial [Polypterus senegalus]|nr:synaptophysin-like protein 2 [Polypterus senegalus]MBN3292488.1 SYPL2 protein [Polypterus senegalus]